MNIDFDNAVRSSLGDIIAAAPEPPERPMRSVTVGNDARLRRPYLSVAAALVVLSAVGGVFALGGSDRTETSRGVAPSTSAPICAGTGAQVLVPNVAGMPYTDAVAALASAGLNANARRESPPVGVTAIDADYAIIRQDTVPRTKASCGALVTLTAAYRPGPLYIVKEGDTYEFIAASEPTTIEQLLSLNGLTVAELEANGGIALYRLPIGQALRLGNAPASSANSSTTTVISQSPVGCSGYDLMTTAQPLRDSTMSNTLLVVLVKNIGARPCVLPETPPTLEGLSPDGSSVPLVARSEQTYFGVPTPLAAALDVGGVAAVWVGGSVPGVCDPIDATQTWDRMFFRLPDGTMTRWFRTSFDTKCGVTGITKFGTP